jgi:hypothetical protein
VPKRFACFLIALAWWPPSSAYAQSFELAEFSWHAPAVCPDRAEVYRTIGRWLQQSAEPVDPRALSVNARVEPNGPGFRLTLVLGSRTGRSEDQFAADSCGTLVEVIALKVALAASAAAAVQALDAELPGAANAQATSSRSSAESAVRASLRASIGIVIGRLPGASAALRLLGALGWAPARLELGLSYAAPRAAGYTEPAGVGADFQLVSGVLRGCVVAHFAPVELPTCVGLELGVMRGVGFGLQQPLRSDQLFGEVAVGPAVRWSFAPGLFAWFELDGSLAFLRPAYQVRDAPLLFRTGAAALRTFCSLELEF